MTTSQSGIDPREFRRTMGRFATGVTVITAKYNGKTIGMTANAFMSVSLEPPLILVSVDKKAHMHAVLLQANRYGVSILNEHQEQFSNYFAGRPVDSPDFNFVERQGAPVLDGGIAFITAKITEAHPAGDHTLFIGQVEYLEQGDGDPLLFYGGQYHRLHSE